MRFSRIAAPIILLSATGTQARPQFPDPLGDLTETLGALKDLLSGDTLSNIVSLVDNGAALLTPQFVNETQSLISLANAVCSFDIFLCLV